VKKTHLKKKIPIHVAVSGFIISTSELHQTVFSPLDTAFRFTTIFVIPKC